MKFHFLFQFTNLSIKFFNHHFTFICRTKDLKDPILKFTRIHTMAASASYVANVTTIAATFPARRSPLTGVSKWRPTTWTEKELNVSDGNGKHEKIFDFFEEDTLLYSSHAFVKKNKYWCFNSIFHRRMSRGGNFIFSSLNTCSLLRYSCAF